MISSIRNKGISPARERVRAQVAGLRPSLRGKRLFMIMQGFFDDSYDNDIFVIGGLLAGISEWERFSKEWKDLLPRYGCFDNQNAKIFKYSLMQQSKGRKENILFFRRVVEKYAFGYVSCAVDRKAIDRALKRVIPKAEKKDWGLFGSHYYWAFRILIDSFNDERKRMGDAIPTDATVDFYFDEQSEKNQIRAIWDVIVESRDDDVRKYYGSEPRFESDKAFLPLQGADYWAGHVRQMYLNGTPEKINSLEFDDYPVSIKDERLRMRIDPMGEEEIFSRLAPIVQEAMNQKAPRGEEE